jgi:hypothetical protein
MMKLVALLFVALFFVGCTPTAIISSNNASENTPKEISLNETEPDLVTQAIALAKSNKDYRLMVTSGRSISIPGVDSSDYNAVIELCGKKYSPEAGDVIRSEAQREARKKVVIFMQQYNEQMIAICQQNREQ